MSAVVSLKRWAVAVAAASAVLVVPSTASAASTCNFAGGVVDIDVTGNVPQVIVDRNGSAIEVTDFGGVPVPCAGGPNVNNVNTITIDETTNNRGTSMVIDTTVGPFAPGLTDEPGNATDEIEFTVTADNTGTDFVSLTGGGADDNFRAGMLAATTTGINLNGAESAGLDVDVTATNIDSLNSDTFGGDDTVTGDASGGAGLGFTGPLTFDVGATGGIDDDTLAAGNGNNNRLDGENGNDTLTGGSGSDSLNPGDGDDTANGAGGASDFLSYLNHGQGVTVDLNRTDAQDTGGAGTETISGFEAIIGSNASDTLIGLDQAGTPDFLVGGQLGNDTGNDVLIGNAGADTLRGAPGNDTLIGGAGNDSLNGAEGTDTVSYAQGSQGAIALSLAQSNTGVAQNTGGAGNDILFDNDSLFGAGDGMHEVENVTGSGFADSLTGNDDPNEIVGGNGQDTINLGGGNDEFDAYDGGQDTVECGAGAADKGTADEQGVDALTACETPDFAPRVSVGGTANGALTNDSTPAYSLSADEGATFQVEVDGGAFGDCAAACEAPALADGQHTLRFRAKDADEALNFGLDSVTRTVTVDTAAPQVQVSGPDGPTQDSTPTFEFSASEDATFECRMDGGGFGACSGPGSTHTPEALGEGPHTFEVRATDGAGNAGTASRAFAVEVAPAQDTDAPETTVKKAKVKGDDATVRFGSDEPGSSFRCKLDKGKFKPCASPKRYRNLDDGKHKVLVAATDAAGNADATPAKAKFKVG